jgi:hypothetical protein
MRPVLTNNFLQCCLLLFRKFFDRSLVNIKDVVFYIGSKSCFQHFAHKTICVDEKGFLIATIAEKLYFLET